MTPEEERLFDERFVQGVDNAEDGPVWLFRVNADGSVSIALPQDIKGFINQLLESRQKKVMRVEYQR